MSSSINRSVITIAVGNNYFYHLTDNLITSFLLWNSENDIILNVVTDNPNYFLKHKSNKVIIQSISISAEEKSFTSKFYLYDSAIAENNLFIDCDCLIYKDIEPVFEELKNFSFTAIGTKQVEGEFFCDIKTIITNWNIKYLPVFIGSVYFFKKNEISKSIFKKASELKQHYDRFGFIRLRGKENEEPLFALSMTLYNQEPYQQDLHIKCDAMFYKKINANILTGKTDLKVENIIQANTYKNYNTKSAYIIHYNASYSDSWMYKIENYRLQNYKSYNLLNIFFGWIVIKTPVIVSTKIKNIFRPVYRFLFGIRNIKKSNRIKHFEIY